MRTQGSNQIQHQHPMRHVLSIDLGSSGYKVAVVSQTGEVIASAEGNIDTQMLPQGGAEQDPKIWWQKIKKGATTVISESGIPPKDIVAVGCDSQWSVVVPVNRHGNPLMNAVHWLDTRGGKYNRRMANGFPKVQGYGLLKLMRWIKMTGLVPSQSGFDSLGHVLFIKNERPDIYAQTYKFLEPMDFITAQLTGKITATQKTMVPFVLVDTRSWGTSRYSEELLNMAGLDKDKFPRLIANDGIVGPLSPKIAREIGLNPSTPVIAGTGDLAASVIGSGAVTDFDPIIYIGTSLYITCQLPFKKTDLTHFMTSLPSPFKSKYLLLGEQGIGGRCVDFFLNHMIYPDDEFNTGTRPEDAYRRFNTMATRASAGCSGVIFLPWLNGSLVPSENPFIRGGFMNLSLNTTRSHMARAIMEGLAYNSRWTSKAVEKFTGRSIERFTFSGGGALSDVWAQIHADVLGVPIRQIDDPVHTTVRGTAWLALITLGYLSIDDIPQLVKIKHVFKPDESNRAVYDKMYSQYRQLFKKNKKIFKVLNTR